MIKNASSNGVGVILLNHNHTSHSFSTKNVKVQFEEVIVPLLESKKSRGVVFDFVAHSAGGSKLISNLTSLVKYVTSKNIGKLMFTDSIHSLRQISLHGGLSEEEKDILSKKIVGEDAVYYRSNHEHMSPDKALGEGESEKGWVGVLWGVFIDDVFYN